MNKEWADIKGFEGLYKVSNYGEILSVKKDKLRKPSHRNGYEIVVLSKQGKVSCHYIHRLVATAFIPNTKALPQVNHKDSSKVNNCITNLEWVTCSENVKHGWKQGNSEVDGILAAQRKLSPEDVIVIRKRLDEGESNKNLALEYKVDPSSISKIKNYKSRIKHEFK